MRDCLKKACVDNKTDNKAVEKFGDKLLNQQRKSTLQRSETEHKEESRNSASLTNYDRNKTPKRVPSRHSKPSALRMSLHVKLQHSKHSFSKLLGRKEPLTELRNKNGRYFASRIPKLQTKLQNNVKPSQNKTENIIPQPKLSKRKVSFLEPVVIPSLEKEKEKENEKEKESVEKSTEIVESIVETPEQKTSQSKYNNSNYSSIVVKILKGSFPKLEKRQREMELLKNNKTLHPPAECHHNNLHAPSFIQITDKSEKTKILEQLIQHESIIDEDNRKNNELSAKCKYQDNLSVPLFKQITEKNEKTNVLEQLNELESNTEKEEDNRKNKVPSTECKHQAVPWFKEVTEKNEKTKILEQLKQLESNTGKEEDNRRNNVHPTEYKRQGNLPVPSFKETTAQKIKTKILEQLKEHQFNKGKEEDKRKNKEPEIISRPPLECVGELKKIKSSRHFIKRFVKPRSKRVKLTATKFSSKKGQELMQQKTVSCAKPSTKSKESIFLLLKECSTRNIDLCEILKVKNVMFSNGVGKFLTKHMQSFIPKLHNSKALKDANHGDKLSKKVKTGSSKDMELKRIYFNSHIDLKSSSISKVSMFKKCTKFCKRALTFTADELVGLNAFKRSKLNLISTFDNLVTRAALYKLPLKFSGERVSSYCRTVGKKFLSEPDVVNAKIEKPSNHSKLTKPLVNLISHLEDMLGQVKKKSNISFPRSRRKTAEENVKKEPKKNVYKKGKKYDNAKTSELLKRLDDIQRDLDESRKEIQMMKSKIKNLESSLRFSRLFASILSKYRLKSKDHSRMYTDLASREFEKTYSKDSEHVFYKSDAYFRNSKPGSSKSFDLKEMNSKSEVKNMEGFKHKLKERVSDTLRHFFLKRGVNLN